MKRYLLPTFGERRLADIDHALVRAWIADLNARDLVVLAGLLMRKIMATAVSAGRIASSPCSGVRLPRIEREGARLLTPSEVVDLTDVMDPRYRGLICAASRRFWRPAVEAGGLAPLRPHDLRHTAVALWIAAGATPREIATRAGHTSVVTVLDRYGHLFPDAEERVNSALDRLAATASNERLATVSALSERGS